MFRKETNEEPDPGTHYFYQDEDGHRLAVPFSHLRFLESLRLHYETEKFIFVHAGLKPGVPLSEQSERDLLWIREKFLSSAASFGKIVVHGHSVEERPEVTDTRIGIDTGSGYGGKLTCVCLPEVKFYFA